MSDRAFLTEWPIYFVPREIYISYNVVQAINISYYYEL